MITSYCRENTDILRKRTGFNLPYPWPGMYVTASTPCSYDILCRGLQNNITEWNRQVAAADVEVLAILF